MGISQMWKRDWQIAIWPIAAKAQQDPWNHNHPTPDVQQPRAPLPSPAGEKEKPRRCCLNITQSLPQERRPESCSSGNSELHGGPRPPALLVTVLSWGEPAPFPAADGAEPNLLLKRCQQGRKAGHGTTTSQDGIFECVPVCFKLGTLQVEFG